MELARAGFLEQFRTLFDVPNARWTATVLATRGERLALFRLILHGDVGEDGGPLEIDHLWVGGVGDDGRCDTIVLFEPGELDAAWAELDALYVAREGALHPRVTAVVMAQRRPFLDRDWDAFAAMHAPDLVCHDHRLLGWGTLQGLAAWVRTQQVLVELAPDTGARVNHVTISEHGTLRSLLVFGQRDGGAFELAFLRVDEIDVAGRICRIDLFDADELDDARARFAEIAADAALARFEDLRPDPLRIPPNAATRTWDRWCAAADVRDWDAIAALYHPSYRSEDRRRLIRLTTDRGGTLENDRFLAEVGWRPVRTLLATAGDRLALQHVLWRTGETGGDSEVETLQLSEVDDEGRFVSSATFDPDDRATAFRELGHRYVGTTRPSDIARFESLRDAGGDLVRLRAALPDDFFFHDHRRTGLGRLDGADAYVASVAALRELAPDAMVGLPLYHLADEPHGTLSIGHSFGTLADGGAYESVYVMIMVYQPEGIAGAELFELEALEQAKARFAELRARGT
jgi:hypothetical protein